MEFYVLDENFLKQEIIDLFVSAIWTERFTAAGEVRLVVEANDEMRTLLAPGTFLTADQTKEVVMLETQSIEDGLLTVTGPSLLGFLKNRFVYRPTDDFPSVGEVVVPRHVDGFSWGRAPGAGFAIINVVKNTVIDPFWPTTSTHDDPELQLNWAAEIIPNLTVHPDAYEGSAYVFVDDFAAGTPAYEVMQSIAITYNVGIRLYLADADTSGYSLEFLTYLGEDRTVDGAGGLNDFVRFSPYSDSLGALKTLKSIAEYKNVAYAQTGSYAVVEVVDGVPTAFDRRAMFVSPQIDEGTSEVDAAAILQDAALNALANNTLINIFDGEVTTSTEYKFGTHYGLGDIVELESIENTIQKARVTEHIRAQDSAGERAYPTVSVITE